GSVRRSDPFRITAEQICSFSTLARSPLPVIHIRQGKSLDDPTICGAEGSAHDWLLWGQLPGTPRMFPLLCGRCWELSHARQTPGQQGTQTLHPA
ncbi:MAG TPA: hypothetical protein VKK81_27740, partial [Candidatus Binatia bacterium]|nr:hypothetical protein [Candidatus Binatia bacterium]